MLTSAARVQAQVRVAGTGAIFHGDMLTLLKTDAVAVIVFDATIPNLGLVPAVEKDASTPTSVQMGIVFFVARNATALWLHQKH